MAVSNVVLFALFLFWFH